MNRTRNTLWLLSRFMVIVLAGLASACLAKDYYVATDGNDTHSGSKTEPWKTIQHAADSLQPGDTVYIRGGVYRECVQPGRGGTSEDKRITFKAFPGETPVIKGSEPISTWQEQGNNVWKAVIQDHFFGDYNPYTTKITGEWMGWGSPLTGGVALDDLSFRNINHENEVAKYPRSWSARHEGTATTIYANFNGANPNTRLAEIYARELLFFPRVNGLRYITLDGLTFLHAANGWVEYHGFQKGAVGTRYGYGWIIQNCHIADCRTVGICSGEYRPKTQNLVPEQNEDIEAVGHHIFRNNLVERCGQAGFIGAYGYAASVIEGNLIQDIGLPNWTENPEAYFGGWESGGIKIHFAVDVTIKNNLIRRVHIYRSPKTPEMSAPGIWIDCGGQGVRITGNVIYDISNDFAIYLEVDHGPLLVDNNVLIDKTIGSKSSRLVLAHNLFVDSGLSYLGTDGRGMPVWVPHTLKVAAGTWCRYVSDRYFNNIYITRGAARGPRNSTDVADYRAGNNVFYLGGKPSQWDTNSIVDAAFDPQFTKTDLPSGVKISFTMNNAPLAVKCPLINYDFIGKYSLVDQGIEDHDGKAITIDQDLLGNVRNRNHPAAGPLETVAAGKQNTVTLIVGPRARRETASPPLP